MTKLAFKAAFAATITLIGAYLQQMLFPVLILIFLETVDYFTGLAVAWESNTLNSRVGAIGIVKKILYFCIIAVGCVFDYLIYLMADFAGVGIPGGNYIGLMVTVWLIINEGISILENLDKIGLPSVPGLAGLLGHLKSNVEDNVTKGRHEK